MRRSHVALFLVVGAPVALYAAVLVPRAIPDRTDEPTSPADFFPTAVGTKWVYQESMSLRGRSGRREQISVVIGTTDRDGERFVKVRHLGGVFSDSLTEWAVSDAGFRFRSLPEQRWARERPEQPGEWRTGLPVRLVRGESWMFDKDGDRSQTVHTIAGWETVHVPAGTYKALRVDIEITEFDPTGKRGHLAGAYWCAPGVGFVKYELLAHFAPYRLVLELQSFHTPAER